MNRLNLKAKIKCMILILLVFCMGQVFPAECGDVNSDGMIDIVDALVTARYYVGLNPAEFDPLAADVDGNNNIDIVDALILARFYVNLISALPGCSQPTPPAQPDCYINEFLSSNATINEDPHYGKFADWIEIYNAGTQPVNLNGFYLTDNLEKPDKWQITQNITVNAGRYILIWADDNNDSGQHTNFKLSQDGEEIGLFTPDLTLLDSVEYFDQTTDISQGRKNDGSSEWAYFADPTPGEANLSGSYSGMVDNVPDFSITGGFYTSTVVTELSAFPGDTIRYTTDGSEPSDNSTIYGSPISISSTTIIRARVFMENFIPGPVITHTYFINENIQQGTLPVVSLASDPENFRDPVKGIYVQDFKPDWEVPINIELFENNGSDRAAFNQAAGTKINGLHSWVLPQKYLGIYFKKRYRNSESKLEYPLFFDRSRDSFKSFGLRTSGSDWSYTLFRDALAQDSTRSYMDVDIQGYRPCVVYINTRYMGIHNMRSKINDDFIEKNFGMESGSYDLIENEEVVEEGSLEAYDEFKAQLSQDLSIQANYDAVAEKMDIQEFTDFIITEIYVRNTSIGHNIMTWKPRNSGKWRWILADLDRGFFNPENGINNPMVNSINRISSFMNLDNIPLDDLMANTGYKAYFRQRMADHLYTTFHPDRMKRMIDDHMKVIEQEMPYHIERWRGATSSYGDAMPSIEYWYDEINYLKTYTETRPRFLLDDLTNYGVSEAADLMILVSPAEAGYVNINGLALPAAEWSGPYSQGLRSQLRAVEKPGYSFKGWANLSKNTIIPRGSIWKFSDDGSDQDTLWRETSFDDTSWRSGGAKLGYGDGNEFTTINYGSDSNNKHITTYFRHSFNITGEDKSGFGYKINILRDDGAVVYLNGQEVLRSNMTDGPINYQTPAGSSIDASAENRFNSFDIDENLLMTGINVLAVEIHQNSPTSSDLAFDLELTSYMKNTADIISTDDVHNFTMSSDPGFIAVFESEGQSLLPADITGNITLNKDDSPYMAQGDITIHENSTLTVEPGVEIWMPEGASIFIGGNIKAEGTPGEPVIFKLNPSYAGAGWGALCFINTTSTSNFTYVTIEDASQGPVPIRDVAAISAFNADLVLDHITIENVNHNPVAARYSDIVLTDSSLHSKVTGDLINVKYGHAAIENCIFRGNDQVDTDAIDYDDVEDGIIRNCKIYNFFGFNSDAIDIGEKAENVSIDNLLVYNITDKGVSVGQKSTARITNSTFVNCNMGLGLKDTCQVAVDHCTFYSNGTAIACFEKNLGSAGGNAVVTNSILSNCSEAPYTIDDRSTMDITFSIADNDTLPVHPSNLSGDPMFINPTGFDFRLNPSSPCIGTGSEIDADMGTSFHNYKGEPSIMFSGIFYNHLKDDTMTEFLTLYNPGPVPLDISGYSITEGIEFTFPGGTMLGAGESFIISKYPGVALPGYNTGNFAQWEAGSLANDGEPLKLENRHGVVIDYVNYQAENPWPVLTNSDDTLTLNGYNLDNHFSYNWAVTAYNDIVVDSQLD